MNFILYFSYLLSNSDPSRSLVLSTAREEGERGGRVEGPAPLQYWAPPEVGRESGAGLGRDDFLPVS